MALRLSVVGMVLAMLMVSGCQSRSNYQPACCGPKVVATAPAPACPTPVPLAPPGAPVYPR